MIDDFFTTFFNKAKQLVCTCAAPRRCSGSADFFGMVFHQKNLNLWLCRVLSIKRDSEQFEVYPLDRWF